MKKSMIRFSSLHDIYFILFIYFDGVVCVSNDFM